MRAGDIVISQENTQWFEEGALGVVTQPKARDNSSIMEVQWISGAKQHHMGSNTWWSIVSRCEVIGHIDE